jgi:hypothetical protein
MSITLSTTSSIVRTIVFVWLKKLFDNVIDNVISVAITIANYTRSYIIIDGFCACEIVFNNVIEHNFDSVRIAPSIFFRVEKVDGYRVQ